MDSGAAQGPSPSITSTHGFVNVITMPPASPDNSWQSSGGLSFLVFMAIGFASTLCVIAVLLGVYFCWRRYLRRQPLEALPVTASAEQRPKPDPRPMVLVVHPGGGADVARKEGHSLDSDEAIKAESLKTEPETPVASDRIPAFRQEDAEPVSNNGEEAKLPLSFQREGGIVSQSLARNSSGESETRGLLESNHSTV